MLETSTPGVFAAGDVRSGSVKRVATAVGDGAIAVQLGTGTSPWHGGSRGDPSPVRTLLLVAAGLVLLAGIPLFVFPLRTADWFAWTVASPMTAVFLGASYWASAVLEVGGARARTWPEGRISVPAVMVFTTLTLVATLLHLPLFHLGADQPVRTRAVAWGWLVVYAVVPVVMLGAPGAAATVRRRTSACGRPGCRAG